MIGTFLNTDGFHLNMVPGFNKFKDNESLFVSRWVGISLSWPCANSFIIIVLDKESFSTAASVWAICRGRYVLSLKTRSSGLPRVLKR